MVHYVGGGASGQKRGVWFLWSKGIHLPGPPVLSIQPPLIIKSYLSMAYLVRHLSVAEGEIDVKRVYNLE